MAPGKKMTAGNGVKRSLRPTLVTRSTTGAPAQPNIVTPMVSPIHPNLEAYIGDETSPGAKSDNLEAASFLPLDTAVDSNMQCPPPTHGPAAGTPSTDSNVQFPPTTHCPTAGTPASSVASTSTRKGRGKAVGKDLLLATRNGQKLQLVWGKEHKRPIGQWTSKFAAAVTTVVHKHISPLVSCWKDVDEATRYILRHSLMEQFEFDLDINSVWVGVNEMLATAFRRWRSDLHHAFIVSPDVVPVDIQSEDWNKIKERFQTEKFLRRSEKNKENRARLDVTHCTGSKSFVQLLSEMRDPDTGKEPERVDFFKKTHCRDSTGTWTTEKAENLYIEMMQLVQHGQSSEQENTDSLSPSHQQCLTQAEAAEKVLGSKPGYVRGMGHGVMVTTSRRGHTAEELEEMRRRADHATARWEETMAEAASAKEEAFRASEEARETRTQFNAFREQMTAFMAQFRPPAGAARPIDEDNSPED